MIVHSPSYPLYIYPSRRIYARFRGHITDGFRRPLREADRGDPAIEIGCKFMVVNLTGWKTGTLSLDFLVHWTVWNDHARRTYMESLEARMSHRMTVPAAYPSSNVRRLGGVPRHTCK
jgi:hypothetical protein